MIKIERKCIDAIARDIGLAMLTATDSKGRGIVIPPIKEVDLEAAAMLALQSATMAIFGSPTDIAVPSDVFHVSYPQHKED